MISRQDFLDALMKEVHICKHLYTKIPKDAFDFRPSEGQRSTLELLRYLAVCGSASMYVMLNGSDWKLWKPYTEKSINMNAEDFIEAMENQAAAMKEMLDAIPEDYFFTQDVKHPNGAEMKLGLGLMTMPYAWLVAYRMQLFLYLKQIGVTDIGTSNVWGGADRKVK